MPTLTASSRISAYENTELPLSLVPELFPESMLTLVDSAVLLTHDKNQLTWCSQNILSVLGITREEALTAGWNGLLDRVHPSDKLTLHNKLFPILHHELKKLSRDERGECHFNYTLRFNLMGGSMLMAFENKPVEWNVDGLPVVYMTVVKNIDAFTVHDAMVLTITQCEKDRTCSTRFRQEFPFGDVMFSPRETEIIRLMAQGLNSKQMATKLFISADTVRNHRKKMLQKSSCHTAAELVTMAIRRGVV